jgi:hypothetical protein
MEDDNFIFISWVKAVMAFDVALLIPLQAARQSKHH